ncbi:HAD family hydrolase [Vibrio amylolyticus]|uniref:HAD family hydrolase n=1 Tax=Vibrio amylolyticus TaxID=2847292 RepID=UPI0035530015
MSEPSSTVAAYLFDWGDTLMVDFPDAEGKMCDWHHVEAVSGAKEMLEGLSAEHRIYVATSAKESSEQDIVVAFQRVGLDQYISGYFCLSNLGIAKGSADFYRAILANLDLNPEQVTMVGDTPEKDILPAIEAGLSAIYFNPTGADNGCVQAPQIRKLTELITAQS